jgi:predicted transcriptional regulator
MVEEAIERMLEYDERFIAAVEEGRASACRGEFLEHNDVVERSNESCVRETSSADVERS